VFAGELLNLNVYNTVDDGKGAGATSLAKEKQSS